ncbi:hypothetical protein LS70_000055 [Helicobacter sp. MIT 11-5569]|uniref:hypothetical protein n=1 Tax=Helicobacter sp. MIT 11-5569 TaxID=1548151 RepID=UPI0010FD9DFD|nr:hypothetical protein [Helicobacter sp. MIT 11-5569]TLD84996.1 hypothetical protein LS70_000055 [Helicobacter sp. MIT 11-5569]
MQTIELDIFGRNGEFLGKKRFYPFMGENIGKWIAQFRESQIHLPLGMLNSGRVDFQNQKLCYIKHNISDKSHALTLTNLIPCAVFFSVRHAIPAAWINDRDQFLYPNNLWEKDSTFQNNCLAFMLFSSQNKITSLEDVNHFIPFSESQVGAKEAFEFNFMRRFINGKIKDSKPLDSTFQASEAKEVFAAGLELWKYYHAQDFNDSTNPYNANASLYDIKAHFQGFNDKGKMNPPQKAQDSYYKDLIGNLNFTLNSLVQKIEPKIYEYGFLLE